MRFRLLAMLFLLSLSPHAAAAAEGTPQEVSQPATVIEDIGTALRAHYVYSERAAEIEAALEAKSEAGRYAAGASPEDLASLLSDDLVEITGDYHFYVGYAPADQSSTDSAQIDPDALRRSNFELKRVEILPGNVGYLRLDYFADTDDVFDLATGAMQFLSNSDALILDLRYNRGGHLETAQLLMSYLFPGDKDQELFHYFYNEDGKTIRRGQWVLAGLPGKRMPDIPVYVLTSTTTFSAGEWTAFSLAELDRAIIVGQRTAGAAHPVDVKRIDDDFVMQVPIGIVSGPVSGTDFEGKGVAPDIEVPSHRALGVAHRLALEQLAKADPSSQANWYLPLVGVPEPADISRDVRDISGSYEGRRVTIEDGSPIYSWRDRFSLALTPLGGGLFAVEGTDDYRFRLVRKNGKVTALAREFREGGSSVYQRID